MEDHSEGLIESQIILANWLHKVMIHSPSTSLGTPVHLLILQLSNQPIMWQQCSALNYAETGQELQLMFTSSIRMCEKWDLSDFYCGTIVGVRLAGLIS